MKGLSTADEEAIEAIRVQLGEDAATQFAAEVYKLRVGQRDTTWAGVPRWVIVLSALWLAVLETADKLPQVLLAYPRYEATLAETKAKLMQPDLVSTQLQKAQIDVKAAAYQPALLAAQAYAAANDASAKGQRMGDDGSANRLNLLFDLLHPDHPDLAARGVIDPTKDPQLQRIVFEQTIKRMAESAAAAKQDNTHAPAAPQQAPASPSPVQSQPPAPHPDTTASAPEPAQSAPPPSERPGRVAAPRATEPGITPTENQAQPTTPANRTRTKPQRGASIDVPADNDPEVLPPPLPRNLTGFKLGKWDQEHYEKWSMPLKGDAYEGAFFAQSSYNNHGVDIDCRPRPKIADARAYYIACEKTLRWLSRIAEQSARDPQYKAGWEAD